MRATLYRLAAVAAALSFASCDRHRISVSTDADTPAPATATPRLFAPPGVYYLLSSVSIVSRDGIYGMRPGQRVVKLRKGVYASEGHMISLRDYQVTNYLPTVEKLLDREARTDAAFARQRASLSDVGPAPGMTRQVAR